MIYSYSGEYKFDRFSINSLAPDKIGVYYCGYQKLHGGLYTLYVGRAKGDDVTIKSRLFDHLREKKWSDVTHFGFKICTTKKEAEDLEAAEIKRLKPKHNTIGKAKISY